MVPSTFQVFYALKYIFNFLSLNFHKLFALFGFRSARGINLSEEEEYWRK